MGAHSRQIGDIAVTALSDGVLATGLDVVLGIDKAEAERLAGKTAGEPVDIAVNAFLLELNGRYVLVDAGSGNTLGPTLGKLTDSLRAIGVAPERIDTILLTHVHSDHSNVLVDDDGRAVYPNAQLVLHGGSGVLARPRRGERRQRAHPPQYRQGARDHRALSQAHAHGA